MLSVLDGKNPTENFAAIVTVYGEFKSTFADAVLVIRDNTNAAVPQAVFDSLSRVNNAINISTPGKKIKRPIYHKK